MEPLILITDDEKSIRHFLKISLESQMYQCMEAGDGKTAIMLAASYNPDVILLDLGLPDVDGMDVIKNIRSFSQKPIVVISARGHEREKILALDAGADDYLTKPFSVPELLARIRVILRKRTSETDNSSNPHNHYQIKNLYIDTEKYQVALNGTELKLTPNEFKVLVLLAANQGKVLTHQSITHEIWGRSTSSEVQSLRVCMGNLRRKLSIDPAEPEYIQTEIGIGYRMIDE